MKKFYKSKTIIVNVLSIALLLMDKLSGLNWIPEEKAVVVIGAINLALRVLTKEPLKW